MQQIKMKSTAAGPNGTMLPGKCYPVDDDQAKMLVDGGYADYETTAVNPESIDKAGKFPDVGEIKKLAEGGLVDEHKGAEKDSELLVSSATGTVKAEEPLVKPVWGKK